MATVSACADGPTLPFLQTKGESPEAEVSRNASSPTRLVEKDVEAPDVFSASEAGLWDGRPSLGGVWVAHPDVTEPERVIIRNTSNGKFVIGALFRRERDIPGPRFQASSDAARALDMLAGAPVKLSVTALRREEVKPEPEPEAVPAPQAQAAPDAPAQAAPKPKAVAEAAVPAAAAVKAEPLDPIAGAAAEALAATKPRARPKADAAQETPAVAALTAGPAEPAEALEATSEDSVATAPKAKKGWFGQRLFSRKRDPGEPLNALKEDLSSAEPVTPQIRPAAAAPSPTRVSAAPLPPAKPVSHLKKPYLQIGIFSVHENAENTADQMRHAGIIPTIYEQSTNGKKFWRVVVGPARTKSEQSALLGKIKDVGFTDAYAVTN